MAKLSHRRFEDLPLLASTVSKLCMLNINDEDYLEQVQQLAEADPALGIKLIQMANVSGQRRVKPIINIKDATARLGIKRIFEMENGISTTLVFCPVSAKEKELWYHSIEVACMCRQLVTNQPHLKINKDQAYFCGLVHDVGSFVLFRDRQHEFNYINEQPILEAEELLAMEDAVLNVSHSELGAYMIQRIGLPSIIREMVKHHHNYTFPHSLSQPKTESLLRVLQLSDILSKFCMTDLKSVEEGVDALMELIVQWPPLCEWQQMNLKTEEILKSFKLASEEANLVYNRLGLDSLHNLQV